MHSMSSVAARRGAGWTGWGVLPSQPRVQPFSLPSEALPGQRLGL